MYIEIRSPARNQTVPTASNLTISDDSINNATSNCQVAVKVNGVRPYQNATAAGPNDRIASQNGTLYLALNILQLKKAQTK